MVCQRDLPAEPRGEIHHRRGVRSRTEQQDARRQRQRQHEQPPAGVLQPAACAARGGRRQRLLHCRRAEGTVRSWRHGRGQGKAAAGRRAAGRLRHHADRGRLMRGEGGGEMRERLPVVVGACPQQQDVHGALAAESQAPQQVVAAAHVVAHLARLAAGDDAACVLAQIPFQAAAGDQARVLAVCGDENERTGLAIGGAAVCISTPSASARPAARSRSNNGSRGPSEASTGADYASALPVCGCRRARRRGAHAVVARPRARQ